nr:squamosa promoter-binding protein 1 [Ipomoea batatas]
MFLAVSSVGKALSSDHVEPDATSAWDSLWGCPSVTRCISTCVEYLKGHQDTPPSECCLNMRFLVSVGVREDGGKKCCNGKRDLLRHEDNKKRRGGSHHASTIGGIRVCEHHAKAQVVIIAGLRQTFLPAMQADSNEVGEFDDAQEELPEASARTQRAAEEEFRRRFPMQLKEGTSQKVDEHGSI